MKREKKQAAGKNNNYSGDALTIMTAGDERIFEWLLSGVSAEDAAPYHNFDEWKKIFFQNSGKWNIPVDRAIAGGCIADCVAYAFWAGLQAGLQSLFENLPENCAAAFCVTESSGNHPRNIKSMIKKLEDASEIKNVWLLNGEKHYISGAFEADLFIAAASEGVDSSGKNCLRMILVDSKSPGISVTPMHDLKILPEVTHGVVRFDNVEITSGRILRGDAYNDYIKPFRTVEDLYVVSAILGYLCSLSRVYGWPKSFCGKIIYLLVCARTLCISDPKEAWVHIALGGLLEDIIKFFKELEPCWKLTDEKVRNNWERDTAIMNIAFEARVKRLEKAWKYYGID